MTTNPVELRLVKQLTGANEEQIVFIDTGGTSRVYIIDEGRLVIKFPRNESTKKEYADERKILTLLENIHSDVKLPKLRWTHPDNEYLGYEGIVGRAFDELSGTATVAQKEHLGYAIGAFIKKLHSLDLENVDRMSVDEEIQQLHKKYGLIQETLSRYLSNEELSQLDTLVNNEIPTKMHRLGNDPVLCHGDLGYWNIIVNDNGMVGVIDFGDIGYYDRSKDFIGLDDNEALEAALAVYGDDLVLRQKIEIRSKLLWILDFWFHTHMKDEKNILRIAKKIKRGLSGKVPT